MVARQRPGERAIRIGVLALQGDVREHVEALQRAGQHLATGTVCAVPVRRVAELDAVDAMVLPGGESTTMDKLLRIFDLYEPLRQRIAQGMPTFGSCAGMVLLARHIEGGIAGQQTLGGLDITVRRNAFGRQVDSFEAELDAPAFAPASGRLHAVFIRAPWVQDIGPGVEVLARAAYGRGNGRIVAVRQLAVLATAFHPEITQDSAVHSYFVHMVADRVRE